MTPPQVRASPEWVRAAVVAAQQIPAPVESGAYCDAADVLGGIGLIQLDPLTRVSTAQRLTPLTRLPRSHRAEQIDRSLWPLTEPASFEAFTKVACVFPLADWPLLRLRREAVRERHAHKLDSHVTGRIRDLVGAHSGGTSTGAIEAAFGPERTAGWQWSEVKKTAELMVRMGELVVTARDGAVRLFDLPERALPTAVREAEHLPPDELRAGLARRAAANLAVMTTADFAHHYHLSRADAAAGIELAGLVPVHIDGWREPGYALLETLEQDHHDGLGPAGHARLIGPFDPLLRDRRRALRIFGFDYTFEAYVPRAKRTYGHYVMGILSGSRFVGRADLQRAGGVLRANQAWTEAGVPRRSAEARARSAVKTLAAQLGADPETTGI